MERLFINFLEQASDSLVKKSVDYFLFLLTKVPIFLSTGHTISSILDRIKHHRGNFKGSELLLCSCTCCGSYTKFSPILLCAD